MRRAMLNWNAAVMLLAFAASSAWAAPPKAQRCGCETAGVMCRCAAEECDCAACKCEACQEQGMAKSEAQPPRERRRLFRWRR